MTIERMKVIRDQFKSLRMCMTEFMLPSITMECHECDLQDIESILDDYITLLEQEPIIDKIRSEIDRQDTWLAQAGYNAYNVDIAIKAIKLLLTESEE